MYNEKKVAINLLLQGQLVSLALALATLNRVGNAVALVCNASSRNEFTITQRLVALTSALCSSILLPLALSSTVVVLVYRVVL